MGFAPCCGKGFPQFREEAVRVQALCLGLKIEEDPVSERRKGAGEEVLAGGVKAALQEGANFCGQQEGLSRPRTCPVTDVPPNAPAGGVGFRMGGHDEFNSPRPDLGRDGNRPRKGTHLGQAGPIKGR